MPCTYSGGVVARTAVTQADDERATRERATPPPHEPAAAMGASHWLSQSNSNRHYQLTHRPADKTSNRPAEHLTSQLVCH